MSSKEKPTSTNGSDLSTPYWDREARTLYFAGQVVKQFTMQAPNQLRLLDYCQEQGWPRHVDNAMYALGDGPNRKRRFHDTVVGLNENHVNRAVRFHAYAEGQGLWWEPIRPARKRRRK